MSAVQFIFDATHRQTKYGNSIRTAGVGSRTTGGNTVSAICAASNNTFTAPWFQLDDDGDTKWSDLVRAVIAGATIDSITVGVRCATTILSDPLIAGMLESVIPSSDDDQTLSNAIRVTGDLTESLVPINATDLQFVDAGLANAVFNALGSEAAAVGLFIKGDINVSTDTTVFDTDGTPATAQIVVSITYTTADTGLGPKNILLLGVG